MYITRFGWTAHKNPDFYFPTETTSEFLKKRNMNTAIRKDGLAVSGQMLFFFIIIIPSFYPGPERNPCHVCDLLTPSIAISQGDII